MPKTYLFALVLLLSLLGSSAFAEEPKPGDSVHITRKDGEEIIAELLGRTKDGYRIRYQQQTIVLTLDEVSSIRAIPPPGAPKTKPVRFRSHPTATPKKDPKTGLFIRKRWLEPLPEPPDPDLIPWPKGTGIGTVYTGMTMVVTGGLSILIHRLVVDDWNKVGDGVLGTFLASIGITAVGLLLTVTGGSFMSLSDGVPAHLAQKESPVAPWVGSDSGGLVFSGRF